MTPPQICPPPSQFFWHAPCLHPFVQYLWMQKLLFLTPHPLMSTLPPPPLKHLYNTSILSPRQFPPLPAAFFNISLDMTLLPQLSPPPMPTTPYPSNISIHKTLLSQCLECVFQRRAINKGGTRRAAWYWPKMIYSILIYRSTRGIKGFFDPIFGNFSTPTRYLPPYLLFSQYMNIFYSYLG